MDTSMKNDLRSVFEMHKRIIKPWKKHGNGISWNDLGDQIEDAYILGWNDCVKEVQKMHDKYMEKFEEIANDVSKSL